MGGNYGLLSYDERGELVPNPDYWMMVLWKKLIGDNVLDVQGLFFHAFKRLISVGMFLTGNDRRDNSELERLRAE